jgi:hypothetical protein
MRILNLHSCLILFKNPAKENAIEYLTDVVKY